MKIYISGKITGLPYDEAKAKFDAAERELAAQGYEVVNPTNNGIPISAPWELHIAMDIIHLIGCHAIYMLPDWEISKGATLEKNIAELTGKTIIYQETPAFASVKQAIADVMGVSFVDIVGPSRERKHVFARFIFAHYCMASGPKVKVKHVAEAMKHDHSTVIYYLRKFKDDNQFNPEFKELVARVESTLSKN
jgi:hypothetical protein